MRELDQLTNLLRSQVELHERLLTLENAKTKVLIKGDIGILDQLMKEEQPLMMECSNLEFHRQNLQETMGLGGKTLREIAEEQDAIERLSIQLIFDELSGLLEKLKKVNQLNMTILSSRLQTIQFMNTAMGFDESCLTYQNR